MLSAQLPQNCNTDDRLLMMGDSWAQYMYDDNVHNAALSAYGQADKTIRSSVFEVTLFSADPDPQGSYYAVSGSEARQWRDESTYAYLQNVRDQLNANPQIKLVIFSLGGNDVLAGRSDCGWYKNMDLDPDLSGRGCGFSSEAEFFDKLESDITWIINEVLAVRPDIEVLISSYDYPNFNVTTSWAGCLGCDLCDFYACPKRYDLSYDVNGDGSIDGNELITDAEINQMMLDIELRRQAIANANPRIYYDNSMGLTQYYYGYAAGLGGTTPYPGDAPNYSPGGNPSYPTERDNFRLVSIPLWFDAPADPIHLTASAYFYKAKHQMDRVIFEKMRGLEDEPHHLTVWSEGNNDGYVDILDNNAFLNGLRMGDEDTGWFGLDNDYRSILSFDTGILPDNAVVTGASLYIIRSSEVDNPFYHTDRNPVMDIKNGYFGSSPGLEVADGTSPASATNIGCFVGKAPTDKYAIRVDVNPNALQYVNTTGKTQFRLYFDYADWSDEYINFYDGAGNPGLLPPSEEEKNNAPVYEHIVRKKKLNSDGTYTEEIIEQSGKLQPREGYIFEEIVTGKEEDDDGNIIETVKTLLVVEHPGLAKYMKDKYNAPANGYAPFLDISYSLVLPVDLVAFSAKKSGNNALLTWETASEAGALGFEIQHSEDRRNWEKIGWQDAVGQNAETMSYQFLHRVPSSGYNYYRLKMIDQSGAFEYSDVKDVFFDEKANPVVLYPNPAMDVLHVRIVNPVIRPVRIQVVDIFGKVLIETTDLDIRVGDLPRGTYFVRIELDNFTYMEKVLLSE